MKYQDLLDASAKARIAGVPLAARVQAHLAARWEYLGGRGWHGTVTRARYFAANRRCVTRNLRAADRAEAES